MKRKKLCCMVMTVFLLAGLIIPATVYSQSSGSVIYAGKSDLPSAPAVKLLVSGNFFMELKLTQTVTEEGASYQVTGSMVLAGKDGKLFTNNSMKAMGMEMQMTQVYDGTDTWEVDLAAKTYAKAKTASDAELFSTLDFVRQGKATVNGEEMLYDRYEAASGEAITFFIRKGKIAVLGMEAEGEVSYFSVMELRAEAPEGLLFEIPADYTKTDSPDQSGIGDIPDNYIGDLDDYLSEDEIKDLEDLFGEDFDINDLIGGDVDLDDLLGDLIGGGQ
ncbi:MAG: hypothetical protein IJA58_08635 [Lachnospiraceae bacterium]|nr:hypothetical protein [Lachnospiraceae bacterium]